MRRLCTHRPHTAHLCTPLSLPKKISSWKSTSPFGMSAYTFADNPLDRYDRSHCHSPSHSLSSFSLSPTSFSLSLTITQHTHSRPYTHLTTPTYLLSPHFSPLSLPFSSPLLHLFFSSPYFFSYVFERKKRKEKKEGNEK